MKAGFGPALPRLGRRGGRMRRTGLQAPGLREGILARIADDQVIEDTHVDELQRFAQPPRDELVRVAGFGNAAGVVVIVMCP
jgi:hypothetical protein